MQVQAVKTPIIKPEQNLAQTLSKAIENEGLKLEDHDIIAVSSKAIATAQGRIIKLANICPSQKAEELAEKHAMTPQLTQLILVEAEKIYGGVKKAILTLKNGVLTVNAGIDNKNAPKGHVALWPLKPQEYAENLRKEIRRKTGKRVGVIIVDSEVMPLRVGTRGLAIAVAGFRPLRDCRGDTDLYKKPLIITRHAVADDLASTAHLLMGEASERTPFVLIKNAPATFAERKITLEEMQMPINEDVYVGACRF